MTNTVENKTSGRFDYVKYDEVSATKQLGFKNMFLELEKVANEMLPDSRGKSLFLTALEEAYMWTGKAIRDEQISRCSQVADVPERTNE